MTLREFVEIREVAFAVFPSIVGSAQPACLPNDGDARADAAAEQAWLYAKAFIRRQRIVKAEEEVEVK